MRNVEMGPPPIDHPRKKRRGCFGCLTQVLFILLLGCVLAVAMQAVFYPWALYFGGHRHWLPFWQGMGHIHGPGGDYVLYFWIQPQRGGRTFNLPWFTGTGYLCSPHGERYKLRVMGGMNEHTGIDTNGKQMKLDFSHRPWNAGWTGNYHLPPRITLNGRWQNPDLVMDDGGTLAGAFLPDGSLSNARNNYYHADSPNKVPVVFHEVGWDAAWRDCPTQ